MSQRFNLESAGDHAIIEVNRELVHRTTAANIVLASTLGGGLALALAGFALYQAANGASNGCSGWFCISDQAAGHFFGVVFGVLGGVAGVVGSTIALVLYTVPANRVNIRVAPDKSAPRVRWAPAVGVDAHGASLGLGLAF
jgi:hypothetical protein